MNTKNIMILALAILLPSIFGLLAYSWIIDQTNKLPIQFNPESAIDRNETEYEECIRVWNDTVGLELLKDRNETLAGQCSQ